MMRRETPLQTPQDEILRVASDGRFRRKVSEFRHWVRDEDDATFRPDADRYHLYVAWACPWAHRTLIHRKVLGLEDAISYDVVHWLMNDDGSWSFGPQVEGDPDDAYPDNLHDRTNLQEVYLAAEPDFHGIGTVPVLWDKQRETIVNNESREIVRMMDTTLRPLQSDDAAGITMLPPGMEQAVDEAIDAIYEPINNGVYRCGFARTQEAYDEAVAELFDALAHWDEILSGQRYIAGDGNLLTEADWFLFTTLLRFDPVYHYHFKCNKRRLRDHHHLWNHTLELHQYPGVAETVVMDDIKRHYFGSHTSINPYRIVPAGPELDLDQPHDRFERFGAKQTAVHRTAD